MTAKTKILSDCTSVDEMRALAFNRLKVVASCFGIMADNPDPKFDRTVSSLANEAEFYMTLITLLRRHGGNKLVKAVLAQREAADDILRRKPYGDDDYKNAIATWLLWGDVLKILGEPH